MKTTIKTLALAATLFVTFACATEQGGPFHQPTAKDAPGFFAPIPTPPPIIPVPCQLTITWKMDEPVATVESYNIAWALPQMVGHCDAQKAAALAAALNAILNAPNVK